MENTCKGVIIGDSLIAYSDIVRNHGAVFDTNMTMYGGDAVRRLGLDIPRWIIALNHSINFYLYTLSGRASGQPIQR